MGAMANYFQKLESHEDLEVSIIRATKIHRVLKMIAKLSSIPKDEEYHFRRRSIDILAKWKNLLDTDVPADEKEKEKPTTNGVHKEDSEEIAEATEKTEKAAEKEPEEDKEAKDTADKAEKEVTSELKDEDMPDVEAEEKKQEAAKEGEAEKTAEETAA